MFGDLVSNVLGEYGRNGNSCNEEFQFCSNKPPSGNPGHCEKNGGYPDDLNLDTTSYSDYSQYQSARALKPCFNKEREEGEEEFAVIDIFTENNLIGEAEIEYGGWKTGYSSNRRNYLQNNNLGDQNAVAIFFEEPESRMALIDYLE